MSYRDDLQAAHDRIAALERERAELIDGTWLPMPRCQRCEWYQAASAANFPRYPRAVPPPFPQPPPIEIVK